MSWQIKVAHYFARNLKKLSKKHRSIHNDYELLLKTLNDTPEIGTHWFTHNDNKISKYRLNISGKKAGKSSGARVIYYKIDKNFVIWLLAIYDKSVMANISKNTVIDIIESEIP